jgi:hypothetical protein
MFICNIDGSDVCMQDNVDPKTFLAVSVERIRWFCDGVGSVDMWRDMYFRAWSRVFSKQTYEYEVLDDGTAPHVDSDADADTDADLALAEQTNEWGPDVELIESPPTPTSEADEDWEPPASAAAASSSGRRNSQSSAPQHQSASRQPSAPQHQSAPRQPSAPQHQSAPRQPSAPQHQSAPGYRRSGQHHRSRSYRSSSPQHVNRTGRSRMRMNSRT